MITQGWISLFTSRKNSPVLYIKVQLTLYKVYVAVISYLFSAYASPTFFSYFPITARLPPAVVSFSSNTPSVYLFPVFGAGSIYLNCRDHRIAKASLLGTILGLRRKIRRKILLFEIWKKIDFSSRGTKLWIQRDILQKLIFHGSNSCINIIFFITKNAEK